MINILFKKISSEIDISNIPLPELNKISKYGSIKRRQESLNGLYLLAVGLKEHGIDSYVLSYKEKGKPYIENSDYCFNISHSNEYVVCAISDKEIGIDIELIKEKIVKLQSKITDEKIDDKVALTELWTLKESFVKYLGSGIAMDLKKIKTKKVGDFFEITYSNNVCYAKMVKVGNYIISVCQESIIHDDIIIKEYN